MSFDSHFMYHHNELGFRAQGPCGSQMERGRGGVDGHSHHGDFSFSLFLFRPERSVSESEQT